ncbi:M23 peptidase domain protein [Richelia intracellularis]|nr:M23 peptidase domain protein [Richelia intracellularis]
MQSLSGTFSASIPAVVLVFPLENGNYLVANGGSNIWINAHLKLLDKSLPRFQAYRGSGYGVDMIKIDSIGLGANGLLPTNPPAQHIYGERVLAPCSGKIMKTVDGLADMTIPKIDAVNRAGNHVILCCGDVDVLLAHFGPQTIAVSTGTIVKVGVRIAEVANSSTSNELHLHIHTQRFGTDDQPFSGDPLRIKFEGRFLVRCHRVISK